MVQKNNSKLILRINKNIYLKCNDTLVKFLNDSFKDSIALSVNYMHPLLYVINIALNKIN